MPRAVDGTRRKDRRNKILKQAKGYWGRRSKLFKTAKEVVTRALTDAYRDRRVKKRTFRALWITRISALCRQNDITYSRFMQGLKRSGVQINRKALSNLAIEDAKAFQLLILEAKSSLEEQVP